MASIQGRVDEANKFMEKGHDYMKTGLLKWTPDHYNAANQYQQAAMAFKGAGLHQKAIQANDLAIKCYLATQDSAFQAAKCMEQAAISCGETGDLQGVSKYYMRAIDVYRNLGQMDSAITSMDKAGKFLATKVPSMAAEMYVQASEACVIEDRYRQAAEFCNRAATLYVKAGEYQRAANILKEEINCYAQAGDTRTSNRSAISLILLHIASKDFVQANEVLRTCRMDDDVYQLAHNLVTGYDKKDPTILNPTLNNSFFRNLDNEYAKIARDILKKYGQIPEKLQENAPASGKEEPQDEPDDQLL